MSDRVVRLVNRIATTEGVRDAWPAKSFTDRLIVVETPSSEPLPSTVRDLLSAAGFAGADEVYDLDAEDAAFAGRLDDCRRYRFVDTESRGQHRSYVVE